jgi:hypothetical protein
MSDEAEENDNPPATTPETNEAVAFPNPPIRRSSKFKPGQSGNPAGRPRNPKNAAEVRELAREKSGAMLEFLGRVALDSRVPINARIQCAVEILNRGWGKPTATLDVNHGIKDPLTALLEEIDGRGFNKTIEGAAFRPALAPVKPVLDYEQGGQADPIPAELGSGKPAE